MPRTRSGGKQTTAPLTYKPGLAPAFVFVQVLSRAGKDEQQASAA